MPFACLVAPNCSLLLFAVVSFGCPAFLAIVNTKLCEQDKNVDVIAAKWHISYREGSTAKFWSNEKSFRLGCEVSMG